MKGRLVRSWDAFWHGQESRHNYVAARVLLAGVAIWVVVSRFDLPALLDLPPELWANVSGERRTRFLLLFPTGVERVLWGALHLTLVAALLGLYPRISCLASGLLLYHFAPLESLIRSPDPYLRGLTLPCLGLLTLGFAPVGSSERWPLRLIQVFIVQMYLFAGWAKLVTSGLSWASAENIQNHLLILNQVLVRPPEGSWGYRLVEYPGVCAFMGIAALVLELGFPVILFKPATRRVLVPLALAFHVANAVLFRIFFQGMVLVLLFVDWHALIRRARP